MANFERSSSVLEKGSEDPIVRAEEIRLEEVLRQTGQELDNIQNLLPAPEAETAMPAEVKKSAPKPPTITLNYWFQEMQKKTEKLDAETQELMNKANAGESLNEIELDLLHKAKDEFWQENYGMIFSDWQEEQRRMPKKAKSKTAARPAAAKEVKIHEAQGRPKEEMAVLASGPKYEHALISEQERLDGTMDGKKAGWNRYWLKRLLPEAELLPEPVKKVVLKYRGSAKGFSLEDSNVLIRYINKRVAAKRFELGKREEMAKLKNNFRNIDAKKDFSPEEAKERRTVFFNLETQSLFVEDKEGNKKEITFGDLIGDYAWGILYKPDASVPPKLWRKIRKTLALYEARDKIGDIFNQELNRDYHTGFPTTTIGMDFIDSAVDDLKHRSNISGTIAERMITEFLTRIQYNNPALGMRVEESNALEDAVLKYDFKIRLKRNRGIALQAEDILREQFAENKRKIGIQFTISREPFLTKKKLEQIKTAKKRLKDYEDLMKIKIDDIVLVSLPALKNFLKPYQRWVAEGRLSGGPEQYLSREEKLAIFKQATQGLIELSDQELEKLKI